jgi:hypothetical protein
MSIGWKWKRRNVSAQDILSGARTLPIRWDRYEIDLTSQLTSSATYMEWARECLARNSGFGWDAALCYAKRATCRELDAFIICNHLGCFLGAPYPRKIELLSKVGLSIPHTVHDLIIDPRNDVEHSYKSPTMVQARHAVEIAELFIGATHDERKRHAIIAISWSISIRVERSTVPPSYERIEFTLTRQHSPMLLVDVCTPDHQVMILHPQDEEILACRLCDFTGDETVELAKLLRQYYTFEQVGTWAQIDCTWFNKLKAQIGL